MHCHHQVQNWHPTQNKFLQNSLKKDPLQVIENMCLLKLMQPLDHLWEMMKTTSRLVLGFFFCVAVSAEENIVVFEVGSGDPAFTQLKADSFANKAIRNSAYLHFTNKTSFKSCWQKYINNKEIKIFPVF